MPDYNTHTYQPRNRYSSQNNREFLLDVSRDMTHYSFQSPRHVAELQDINNSPIFPKFKCDNVVARNKRTIVIGTAACKTVINSFVESGNDVKTAENSRSNEGQVHLRERDISHQSVCTPWCNVLPWMGSTSIEQASSFQLSMVLPS